MKRRPLRAAAVITALAMTFSCLTVSAADEAAAGTATGSYSFTSNENPYINIQGEDTFTYRDDCFMRSSFEPCGHLVALSAQASLASASRYGEELDPDMNHDPSGNAQNILAMLEAMGFSDPETNKYYTLEKQENSCGVTVGHRKLSADGKDYTSLVRAEIGLDYDAEKYNRYDPEKAAEYKAKAIEELTAKGVTFPVTVDYYISGASDVAAQTAKVLENVFAEGLGSDYVVLKTNTYISSLANEVRKPRKASIFINGWGADFADPINFLGQETYNDPQAYYSNAYSMCNQNDDPDLIAAYQEFTDLVVKAKAITNDMDARYAAFAKAEACMLNHALVIPCSYEVGWELTKINNYTKVYSMYGMQAYRYVDWETSETPYTTEEMNANAAAYNAE